MPQKLFVISPVLLLPRGQQINVATCLQIFLEFKRYSELLFDLRIVLRLHSQGDEKVNLFQRGVVYPLHSN